MNNTQKNNAFKEILGKISWWDKFVMYLYCFFSNWYYKLIKEPVGIDKYEKYKRRLRALFITLYGYKVIATGYELCEDVYFFEDETVAHLAFERFEQEDRLIIGWWYGVDKDIKDVSDLELIDKKFEKYFNK